MRDPYREYQRNVLMMLISIIILIVSVSCIPLFVEPKNNFDEIELQKINKTVNKALIRANIDKVITLEQQLQLQLYIKNELIGEKNER